MKRRKATRPVIITPEPGETDEQIWERLVRADAYIEGVRSRGRQIEHNEGCLCTTCRAAETGITHT